MRSLGLVVFFATTIATAQAPESNQRVAQSLFDRGRALMTEGRYAEACPLLAESQKLDPGGGTLLNLALCREKQGRTATAWAEYQEALSLAIRDGREDRKQIANERIAALAGKIPSVVFELSSEVSLTLDGAAIPKLAQSAPLPIDPGNHTLVASAPGFVDHTQNFSVAAGEAKRIRIPALTPMITEPSHADLPPVLPPALPDAPRETRLSQASWIVGGVGAFALAGAGITGVLAVIADRQSRDHVDKADCLPERDFCRNPGELDRAESARDRAKTLAWVSTGALVVGAAALTTAFLLPRESAPAPSATGFSARPVRGGIELGAAFSGSF